MKLMIGIISPDRNCDFQADVVQRVVEAVELRDALLFAVEGLHHDVAAVHLLDVPVDVAQVVLLLLEVLLRA